MTHQYSRAEEMINDSTSPLDALRPTGAPVTTAPPACANYRLNRNIWIIPIGHKSPRQIFKKRR